jgi:hypothetical protein
VVGCWQPCRHRAPLARSPGVSEQGSPLFSKTINFSTYLRPPLSLHRPRLPLVPVPLLQRPRCRCLRSPRCNICNIAWSVVAVSAFCFAYHGHGTLSARLHACTPARLHSPASTCTQPAPNLHRSLAHCLAAAAPPPPASRLRSLRRRCRLSRR